MSDTTTSDCTVNSTGKTTPKHAANVNAEEHESESKSQSESKFEQDEHPRNRIYSIGDDGHISDKYLSNLLTVIKNPGETDVIRQCDGVDFTEMVNDVDRYFLLADEKLHVFPFRHVRPCWHRLYTDTSLVKAVLLLRQQVGRTDELCDPSQLDEVVRTLDMALIMAGGSGREAVLADIFKGLENWGDGPEVEGRPSKRLKISDSLPSEEYSLPKISTNVPYCMHKPTLNTFEKSANDLRQPILLTGILEDWPALELWRSRNYWLKATLGGRRLVPVEVGRSYVDDDWGQQIVPFKTFLSRYILGESDEKGYLAQYDLFHHLIGLNRDIAIPDYCYADVPAPEPNTPVAKAKMKNELETPKHTNEDEDGIQKNIWFGPAWTISPLHHDPYHNILCQVVGKKYIRLYSPQVSERLYARAENEPAPHGEGTINMSNTSAVDVAAIELSPDEDWNEKWPGVSNVPYLEAVLEAGQALYIPVGWWHYVRSCSVGISVSFWWS